MNKYKNKKIHYNGYLFDSQKECERYKELRLLEQAGVITALTVHPKYKLVCENEKFRAIFYKADFRYLTKDKKIIVEDVKGYKKGGAYQLFKIKQKLMYFEYGIEVIEI